MTAVVSADWVLPVEGPPIERGAVAIEGGRVAAVGTSEELGDGRRFPGAAIVPGFVNAHAHLEYAVYGGFGEGLPFDDWLLVHIERKGRIGIDEMEAIARLGAAECLASGITTVADASFSGAAATACAELGLRAVVYLEVFGSTAEELGTRFAANRERVEGDLSDRVRLGISPHAPYTCSADLYAASAELGLPMTTHLAESAAEREWLTTGAGAWSALARFDVPPPPGTTGIRMLADRGLLSSRLVAAHCVDLDEEELELLARHDVAVAHCPRSNALLGCGIAPVADLRAADLRVGIGTDSPASAPSFDMFEELRTAVFLARARERRADALTAGESLELATLGGARALGLEAEVGSLAPGKRADLSVVSLEGSAYHPCEDPAAAVVFAGSPHRVLATLVDGEPRYERGGSQWHEELRSRAAAARSRMLGRSGAVPVAEPA